MDTEGPNAEQISYWNETSGPKWVSLADIIDGQIAPLGLEAMDRAAVQAGERVLDVGCGCGQTSLELAARVGATGASGEVLGLDISGPMLEEGRRRAREAEIANVEFLQADAQTHALDEERFDLIFSRFGIMFFADPAAAFANLLAGLRPGGRIAFVCWQEIGRNPWMLTPALAVADLVTLPAPPAPGSPGPFAFADAERVKGLLEAGGFSEVGIAPLERKLSIGAGMSLDAVVEFMLQMGPVGAALREAGESVQRAASEAAKAALEPFSTGDGLSMESASWIFQARRPS